MSADLLEKAFASTAAVLANVKADRLDDPTPCASWEVRDLLNHVVGGTHLFATIAETGQPPAGSFAHGWDLARATAPPADQLAGFLGRRV